MNREHLSIYLGLLFQLYQFQVDGLRLLTELEGHY